MDDSGKRWTIQDRDGNPIYLTEERWRHIIDADNHPEIADFENHLKLALQQGRRHQEPHEPLQHPTAAALPRVRPGASGRLNNASGRRQLEDAPQC